MPYYQTWEEFARAAEKLYLTDPLKVRVVLKYRHCDGNLCMKVTDDVVDLHRRIGQTCSFPSLEDSKFHYGFNSRYMEQVVSYRRNNFHWLFFSSFAADCNSDETHMCKSMYYKHVHGIDVHYIYAKPKNLPEGARAMPLMMVHSWPGYFYKFCGVFLLLMEPMSPEHIAFEAMFPAFQRGSALGWIIIIIIIITTTTTTTSQQAKTVKDLHVNFALPVKPSPTLGSLLLGRFFPKLFGFSERDITRIFPCVEKLVKDSVKESGYMQGTKPNTAGLGLNDSPVGLAAYILEKMSTWTDLEFRNLENGTGEVGSSKFSLDDLLTNVVIYWPTGSIISSMWLYKENLVKGLAQPHQTILVLAGLAVFPCEVVHSKILGQAEVSQPCELHTHVQRWPLYCYGRTRVNSSRAPEVCPDCAEQEVK
ncbi:hypothetical protein P4O66_008859 [Electrophorus voltai]|uniref:Epoxide hydrolase N-terminal domain-containing protein n=1 Tax=Electrophorus voltai TaxID=2609070 RepID=A0AAD9DX39_9TELE|nr:hypothetical protein P4O66_008859 [Electrophorus voltai]